jgi:hypothetical protein
MLLRGRAATISLEGASGELHLVVSSIQPEAARLLQRRLEEATRRLDLQVVTPVFREVVHA